MSKRPNEYSMEDDRPTKRFHDSTSSSFSKSPVGTIDFSRADPKIYLKSPVLLKAL